MEELILVGDSPVFQATRIAWIGAQLTIASTSEESVLIADSAVLGEVANLGLPMKSAKSVEAATGFSAEWMVNGTGPVVANRERLAAFGGEKVAEHFWPSGKIRTEPIDIIRCLRGKRQVEIHLSTKYRFIEDAVVDFLNFVIQVIRDKKPEIRWDTVLVLSTHKISSRKVLKQVGDKFITRTYPEDWTSDIVCRVKFDYIYSTRCNSDAIYYLEAFRDFGTYFDGTETLTLERILNKIIGSEAEARLKLVLDAARVTTTV